MHAFQTCRQTGEVEKKLYTSVALIFGSCLLLVFYRGNYLFPVSTLPIGWFHWCAYYWLRDTPWAIVCVNIYFKSSLRKHPFQLKSIFLHYLSLHSIGTGTIPVGISYIYFFMMLHCTEIYWWRGELQPSSKEAKDRYTITKNRENKSKKSLAVRHLDQYQYSFELP